MTPINETISTYNGREIYAQTAKEEWSCAGCALDHEPGTTACKAVGPCTPSQRADNSHIVWVYADE